MKEGLVFKYKQYSRGRGMQIVPMQVGTFPTYKYNHTTSLLRSLQCLSITGMLKFNSLISLLLFLTPTHTTLLVVPVRHPTVHVSASLHVLVSLPKVPFPSASSQVFLVNF